MGYRHNTGQNKTIANVTSDTLAASVCAAIAVGGYDWKQGRGMMKVNRSIRKECNRTILIAFAAVILAVCISPALASATYIPPDPTNITNTTSRFWVNYSWTAGEPGNATDSYNVSMNETWTNGTTNTSINETVSSGRWVNITIWAWNASGTGTLSAGCVSDNVSVGLGSIFGLVGSVPTGGGSGRGGTYPPGWFETPAPAVTATKAPASSATATATDARPDDKATPAPTKKPAVTKTTTPAAEDTTAGDAKNGAPGFTAAFVIAGMLAAMYAVMRRRE